MKTITLPEHTEVTLKGYKLPLTPIKDGFGYYGTIAFDKATKTFTQCFMCGLFYKGLSAHIRRTHKTNPKEYKLTYGLSVRTSLAAPVQKKTYRDSQDNAERIANLKVASQTITISDRLKAGQTRKSLIQKNIEGKCPDQLIDKVIRSKEKLGHMPSRREFIKEWGHGVVKSIRNTFGNWGEVIKIVEDVS